MNNHTRYVLVAVIFVFIFAFALYAYTFTHFAPVPNEVITKNGTILFTKKQIVMGKYYFQKYGLMDYGSIEGMGAYFGIGFTGYTARLLKDYASLQLRLDPISYHNMPSTYNSTELSEIKGYLDPIEYYKENNTFVVPNTWIGAFNYIINYYSIYLGRNASLYRLKPNLITNKTIIRDLSAYFVWSVLISLKGYTHGYPYIKGFTHYTSNSLYATFAMIGAIFLVGIPLIVYIIKELLSHWNDPVVKIDLPKPSKEQKIALWIMLIAAIGSGVQGLLGAYMMHLYSTPKLYGLNLIPILPFNVARGLHIWLAIYWISVTWVMFSLFVLPYFGLKISKKQMIGLSAFILFIVFGSLFGIWASYLQMIPSPWWFIFGAQGRDVIEPGSFWVILVSVVLFYASYLFYRASRITIDLLKPFSRVLSYLLLGDGIGIFIGALPIVKPFPYFTEDEFFRWIFIHANVEGFWPGIVIAVLALLLVLQGLIPAGLAKVVVTIDAITEILTGMIGTAHHYYWTGFPVIWMYIGAILSVLEAIPLGMALGYVILASARNKGNDLTALQRVLINFTLVAGIGGSIGVIVFGAGFMNAPILNYFTHDTQFTMAHAHLAVPLAYGLPTILMWVVSYALAGGFSEKDLRRISIMPIIYGIGFYMQALISLFPMGVLQWMYMLKYGFWYVKTIVTPNGHIGFWELPTIQHLIWIRMIGDLTAGFAIAMIIFYMLARFPKAIKPK